MTGGATIIECLRGYQAELIIGRWTLFSGVYKDQSEARRQAEKFCARLHLEINWTGEAPEEPSG